MNTANLVQVFVIQDTRSGNFVARDLSMRMSLSEAGRLYDRDIARDTAICQLGYEYEIHQFWERDDA